jgi:retron-type reverse transcriptase
MGIDGVTVEQYGGQLAANLQTLRARLKAGQYRHQPIPRVSRRAARSSGTKAPGAWMARR